MADLIVRKAHRMDCKDIITLLKEQTKEFEAKGRTCPKMSITEKDLMIDGFQSEPAFMCYVACLKNKLVGFAIFYYTYSIWNGKALFLEHVYVLPKNRNKKIGTTLLIRVAQAALSNNCCKMELAPTLWMNIEFFRDKGAIMSAPPPESHFRCPYEFSQNALKKLVSKK